MADISAINVAAETINVADISATKVAAKAFLPRTDTASDNDARAGSLSTTGLTPWDRWLELTARIDGFPRHLSIHTGGMLITAAPLIDIAPSEENDKR